MRRRIPVVTSTRQRDHGKPEVVDTPGVWVVRGGIEPPASAVSERRSGPTELPDTATSWLTRQDSNLNRLIQNQPCCRLHYGSQECVRRDSNPLSPKATALQAATTSRIRLARMASH